jgi:sulfonate transport system permease protein
MNSPAPLLLARPVVFQAAGGDRRGSRIALRAAAPAVLVLAWWISTSLRWVDPSVLPGPHAVAEGIVRLWTQDDLPHQIGVSLLRALVGGACGISVGLLLGLAAGLSQLGEEAYDSLVQMLRTIPFLALVPLFIVWFGIGETPKLLLIALATSFPMYLNVYAGVRNVDRKVVEAARTFGLRGPGLIREVIVPLAMPAILTGLRYALSISVLVLVAAEQINASAGLGYLLNAAQLYQQVDVILICIAIYAILGLLADLIVRLLEHLLMPWRAGVAAR